MKLSEGNICFSIIVPVYNVEKYISQCIQSVLEQTYTNFELILIDDASTDASVDIIETFCRQDSRIKLLLSEHGAQSRARNKGIECAKGDYIAFLDADDYWKNDHLEMVSRILDDCDMCISNSYNNVFEDGCQNVQLFEFDCDREYTCNETKKLVTDFGHPLPGVTWLNIYKKDFLNSYNIRFNPLYSCSEDLFFFLNALDKARKIVFYSNPFYFYRLSNPSSTINTMNARKLLHRSMVYRYWYDYYNENSNNFLSTNIMQHMEQGLKGVIRNLHKISKKDTDRKELIKYLIAAEEIYNRSNNPLGAFVYLYYVKYYLDIIKRIVSKRIIWCKK